MAGTTDFYGVTAQIIPVLVLALMFEQRRNGNRLPPFLDLFFVLGAVLAAAVGEIVSLREVYKGGSGSSDQYFVMIPLGYLALSLMTPIVLSSYRTLQAEGHERRASIGWIGIVFVAASVAVLTFAATR